MSDIETPQDNTAEADDSRPSSTELRTDHSTHSALPERAAASPGSGPRERLEKQSRIASRAPVTSETLQVGDVLVQRYEIVGQLGRGGFGAVYSARDRSLDRKVAIKQARSLRSFVSGRVRDEARAIASLNHPNIIQIHDLIEISEHEFLIVMECLDGIPLSQYLRKSRMSIVETVRLGLSIVSALQHAHQKQLVHSDLKPANLFLCVDGTIKLLDFGLAVAYFPDENTARIGGTPGYMSPEQVRGESHLIDGRTDVWAFGVVMYEMLTGTRPFAAGDATQTKARTLFKLVPPPRQLNPEIDTELQRIVLKCLQPLIKSRYDSTAELKEDLSCWLQAKGESNVGLTTNPVSQSYSGSESGVSSSLRLGTRGLQPFTESDASTYLGLIPGPRDRNGVPDSIRFWRRWIQSDDSELDHPVGVLYGPSGSGKTSFIRAGLFKQLSADIQRVYLECRPGDLTKRLTRILEAQMHRGADQSSLRDLLHRLRSGDSGPQRYQKVLIVLDQFESWSHSASLDDRMELADALRQCDGIHIRTLLVTREDYWSGAKELMRWLEIPVQEGRNAASVDLLEPSHAEEILESIGRENQTLPEEGQALSKEQKLFLSQAVNELTIDGKVICVHLVMFAQMIRLEQWTPRALKSSGGVTGACSLFFQELFDSGGRSSPEYNRIAPAAREIMNALLPPRTGTVAEMVVSQSDLADAVNRAGSGHLFDDALRQLCEDLRIITIVSFDPSQDDANSTHEDHYRLAHDFLVEPISSFLSHTKSRTWSGRTMSHLSELSHLWSRRPLNAYLPGFWEYWLLLLGSRFQSRGQSESKYLQAATKHHAGRISIAVIGLLGFLFMSAIAWNQYSEATAARQREMTIQVDHLFNGSSEDLSTRIQTLSAFGPDARQEIDGWQDSQDPRSKLIAQIFLQSDRPRRLSPIVELLEQAEPDFFEPVLEIARQTPDGIAVLSEAANDPEQTVLANRAAILLAYLGEPSAVRKRFADTNDLEGTEALVLESTRWRGSPEVWTQWLSDETETRVRYHAGAILGSYSDQELSSVAAALDVAKLLNAKDASLHSMGIYFANRLGEDLAELTVAPPEDANWMLGPERIPMIRLPATSFVFREKPHPSRTQKQPIAEEPYVVENPFWMATIPVHRSFYEQFVASEPVLSDGKPAAVDLSEWEVPEYLKSDAMETMPGTNLDQAYLFCNWLSRREGLTPCFTRAQKPDIALPGNSTTRTIAQIQWDYDAEADGYRVPTIPEYRLAAQAGYPTVSNEMAVGIAERGTQWDRKFPFTRKRYALIPNAYGFFVFDSNKSAWTCGPSDNPQLVVASMAVVANGFQRGIRVTPVRPVNTIYLARNAE